MSIFDSGKAKPRKSNPVNNTLDKVLTANNVDVRTSKNRLKRDIYDYFIWQLDLAEVTWTFEIDKMVCVRSFKKKLINERRKCI